MTEEGYDTYCMFLAIKQTYNPQNTYDYFKYHGKMNVTKESFLKRKDRSTFFKISRYFKANQEHIRNYLFTVLFYDDKLPPSKVLDSNYKDMYKKMFSMYMTEQSYTLQEHIGDYLNRINGDFVESMSSKDGTIPQLASLIYTGEVSPFVATVFDEVFGVFSKWRETPDVFKPFMNEPVERLYTLSKLCKLYLPPTPEIKTIIRETLDKKR